METAKGKTREETINRLADRIDRFEKYTQPHSRLMAELAGHLARRFGLSSPDIDAITEAAMLHDIGLYAMSPAYHALPGPLSFEARLDLWRHPVIGEQQMAKRDSNRHAQLLVRWHHEWWNGSGYPDMLAFEDIPLGARILRAVELCAALLSDRPYRDAQNEQQVIAALSSSAGIECDPYIVKALLSLLDELLADIHRQEAAVFSGENLPAVDAQPEPLSLLELSPVEQSASVNASEAAIDRSSVEMITATETPSAESPVIEQSVLPDTSESVIDRPSAELITATETVSAESPGIEQPVLPDTSESAIARPPAEMITATSTVSAEPSAALGPWGEGFRSFLPTSQEVSERQTAQQPVDSSQATEAIPPVSPALRESLPVQSLADSLLERAGRREIGIDQAQQWRGWSSSRNNRKLMLGFQASVLRQLEFRTIAIPFWSEARLDWYLKAWGKVIFANDPRLWAGIVARANVEATHPLSEDTIARILDEVYVPRVRLANPDLRRWFGETDAWWMDNLRRNIEGLDDQVMRAQAVRLGLQTGDYALSFDEATLELRRPLTTVFWRLAGRTFVGAAGQPQNRTFNQPAEDFIRQARADLLYLRSPSSQTDRGGADARSDWRETWVTGAANSVIAELARQARLPQSKQSYLASLDRMLRQASNFKIWAIEYQEPGLASAQDIIELIKEHRAVKATYSKDVTEVIGGLRSSMIVAEKSSAR